MVMSSLKVASKSITDISKASFISPVSAGFFASYSSLFNLLFSRPKMNFAQNPLISPSCDSIHLLKSGSNVTSLLMFSNLLFNPTALYTCLSKAQNISA